MISSLDEIRHAESGQEELDPPIEIFLCLETFEVVTVLEGYLGNQFTSGQLSATKLWGKYQR